jgi:2-keto-3-deoxy-L-arabinonate dehydratase
MHKVTPPSGTAPYRGVFPVVPTTFTIEGALDLPSQRRCIDFMIEAGAHGLCVLANFSEQFSLSDDERKTLTKCILDHVQGRVPVIVTTSHYSSAICAARSFSAQQSGAAMVMAMPPHHGATLRVDEQSIFEYFARLSDAIAIPIMVQDAPVSGTLLSVALLARMAQEIEQLKYFKIECAGAANKLRDLIALGGAAIEGPWDGEEAITLLADLDAGATGSMTGGGCPEGIRAIFDAYMRGDRPAAMELYQRWLPLINYENRQGGLLTAKALMHAGGIIEYEGPRHPYPPMRSETRAELLALARERDALVLRWAR